MDAGETRGKFGLGTGIFLPARNQGEYKLFFCHDDGVAGTRESPLRITP
jgi:hypothetical protein